MSEPDRLEALEIKLAHLEQSLTELNAVVIRQQREIDTLRTHQRLLRSQIEVLEHDGTGTGFEPPPHY